MQFALVDYLIVAMILVAVVLRIIADIRDVVAARLVSRTMKAQVKRSFSPKLTVVMSFSSLQTTKQALQHMIKSDHPISIIVVVDSKLFSSEARSLRSFVGKQAMGQVKITQTKNPDPVAVIKNSTGSSLAVILPDTAELSETFYYDAIMLFSDAKVDIVQMTPSIRSSKTIIGGIEVLSAAWRRYITSQDGMSIAVASLPEGVIIRTKYIRKMPKRDLHTINIRKPVYSVAAQDTPRKAWSELQRTVTTLGYTGAVLTAIVGVIVFQSSGDAVLAISIPLLVQTVLMWWSLSAVRTPFIDRISITLLTPLFIAVMMCLAVTRSLGAAVRAWSDGYHVLRQTRSTKDIRYNI